MKMHTLTRVATIAALSVSFHFARAQDTLALWDFETNTPADFTGSTLPNYNADSGSGVGTGFHTSASSVWNTPIGNGTANGLKVNNWSAGDYYQFSVSTVDYENIVVTWDQVATATTAPLGFTLSYSVDGSSFTAFTTYTLHAGSGSIHFTDNSTGSNWNASKTADNTSYSYDLSSLSLLDDQTTVYFRLIANSSGSLTNSAVIVDNFLVQGSLISTSAVPEPSTYALLAGVVALGLAALNRRRRA